MKKLSITFFLVFLTVRVSSENGKYLPIWGFYAHKEINRQAVFTLPAPLIRFYKKHIVFITENAVNPDKRRYLIEKEAPCHYIDLDEYGDSALIKLPRFWKDAVAKYTEDSLYKYGIVPWHIQTMKYRLTKAFQEKDVAKILKYSTEIGHYIGDANVPLHTTRNYNGQLTGQHGIHGFWESRLPELFSVNYDYLTGTATYEDNTQLRAWKAVAEANAALDSVLNFEKQLSLEFNPSKKYSFLEKNGTLVKTYSESYSKAYHEMLSSQVEKRMRASIKMTGDFWFTCWVDAGQPDMNKLKTGINDPDSLLVGTGKELKGIRDEH
jgi:hypothetical protein